MARIYIIYTFAVHGVIAPQRLIPSAYATYSNMCKCAGENLTAPVG